MNSEVPPIPESDNSNFKQNDSLDLSLDELTVESTSVDDAWLENDDEDVLDVASQSVISQPEAGEIFPDAPKDTTLQETGELEETLDRGDIDLEIEAQEQESNFISFANTESTAEESKPAALENSSEQDTQAAEQLAVENFSTQDSETIDPPTVRKIVVDPSTESGLFVDSWLDEPKSDSTNATESTFAVTNKEEINHLERQKATLEGEIKALRTQKEQMLLQQIGEVQENMARIVEEGTKELKERKTTLQIEIEKLERRKDRIDQEMRASFAGSSQELAIKVQGFKEYLVGSLQDLARAADKLDLAKSEVPTRTSTRMRNRDEEYQSGILRGNNRGDRDRRNRGASRDSRGTRRDSRDSRDIRDGRRNSSRGDRSTRDSRDGNLASSASQGGQFSEPTFADQSKRIRQLIDQYRNSPDYYGSPWQLRRTFEPIHAKKVQDWFFVQGGRGAVDSMGSRLQNILVASASISILHNLYGDRCRVLVLTDTPENLGEWRRGLQDCLGISRSNFGSNRGVTLFDSPEIVVQRAERLIEEKLLPIIIIDETDELLNLSVIKFPLWLAFASDNKQASSNYLY